MHQRIDIVFATISLPQGKKGKGEAASRRKDLP
jgi:hypothetical protein